MLPGAPVRRPREVLTLALPGILGLLVGAGLLPGVAGVALHAAATPAAATSWPMYLGNLNRNGNASAVSQLTVADAPTFHLRWNYTSGGSIVTQPVVANGHVVFGAWDGYEYSLNRTNGHKIWRTFSGNTTCGRGGFVYGVSSTATLSNGVVYVGGGGPYWQAFNGAGGKLLWQVYTGNNSPTVGYYNWASPLVVGNSAYIGIASACDAPLVPGALWKVDLTTHAVVGVVNLTSAAKKGSTLGATIWSSPSYVKATNTVFVSTGNYLVNINNMSLWDDSIIGFNATTLAVTGHFHVPYALELADGDFGATPTVFYDAKHTPMVGAANKDGYFFALKQGQLSTPAWKLRISTGTPTASAAFGGGDLFIPSTSARINGSRSPDGNQLNGTNVTGVLWAVDPTTGSVDWDIPLPGPGLSAPVYANGVVVVAAGNELMALNASSGSLLWSFNASKRFYGGPTLSGSDLFVGNNNGKLFDFVLNLSANGTGAGGDGGLHGLAAPGTALTTALASPFVGAVVAPRARPSDVGS